MNFGFWKKDYRLDHMGLKDLVSAYFAHGTIRIYLTLAVMSLWIATRTNIPTIWHGAAAILAVMALYPLAWYMLHRYVLHGRFLYKSSFTAKVWKRIHFDHHRDPHDLNILFGALYTTLPTIALVSMPAGYMIAGTGGAALSLAAGLLITCLYEFCHCVQHLNYTPRLPILRRMKRLHLQHHFHDENTNFGITSFAIDKVLGTYSENALTHPQSETVFNLGYTKDEVKHYPWVARLCEDVDEAKAIAEGIDRKRPSKMKSASPDKYQDKSQDKSHRAANGDANIENRPSHRHSDHGI